MSFKIVWKVRGEKEESRFVQLQFSKLTESGARLIWQTSQPEKTLPPRIVIPSEGPNPTREYTFADLDEARKWFFDYACSIGASEIDAMRTSESILNEIRPYIEQHFGKSEMSPPIKTDKGGTGQYL